VTSSHLIKPFHLKQADPDDEVNIDYGSTDKAQIQMVLRILAMLCDGQNSDLQVRHESLIIIVQ